MGDMVGCKESDMTDQPSTHTDIPIEPIINLSQVSTHLCLVLNSSEKQSDEPVFVHNVLNLALGYE